MLLSVYSRLFIDLCERLAEAVPELAWVDHDWGQDQSDTRPALAWPAALIDFAATQYDNIGGLSQFANATLTVRLFMDNFAQSYAAAPKESKEKALACYELERKVVSALHGWAPPDGYCQELIRTAEAGDNRNDIGLRIRTITFTTAFEAVAE